MGNTAASRIRAGQSLVRRTRGNDKPPRSQETEAEAVEYPRKASAMSSVKIEIEEPLAAILHQTNQPVQQVGREMIVLELYRRGTISSGKAAELLGMHRLDFIQHASRLGIPYFALAEDEWDAEMSSLESL